VLFYLLFAFSVAFQGSASRKLSCCRPEIGFICFVSKLVVIGATSRTVLAFALGQASAVGRLKNRKVWASCQPAAMAIRVPPKSACTVAKTEGKRLVFAAICLGFMVALRKNVPIF